MAESRQGSHLAAHARRLEVIKKTDAAIWPMGTSRLDSPGSDWHPPHGRVLKPGDRVVPGTTRRGLNIPVAGAQPHRVDRPDR